MNKIGMGYGIIMFMITLDVITRFAPSPTGLMHFGNLRTALFNYLFAVLHGGKFMLRIEDTDVARSTKEYCNSLVDDLKVFALEYSAIDYQSQRSDIYAKYYAELQQQGAAYPCFCSEEKLARIRKLQLASSQAPRYPGTCSNLTASEVAEKFAQGLTASLRFKVPRDKTIEFSDLLRGEQKFSTNDLGDFIIRRATGTGSFMFCNAIDDSVLGVTHALRGEDHLTNTPRQIMILQQLQLRVPTYGHFPMILGTDGAVLSKRNGSTAVSELCKDGYNVAAINNYLARLGHRYCENNFFDLQHLAKYFNLDHIGKAPARYDPAQLKFWQKEFMQQSSSTAMLELIKPYIIDLVPEQKLAGFTTLIMGNIIMPNEAAFWAKAMFAQNLEYSEEAATVINTAGSKFFYDLAKIIDLNLASFQDFMNLVKQKTEYRGKKLFQPLRAAITTVLHGPELKDVVALLGWTEVKKRFEHAANL